MNETTRRGNRIALALVLAVSAVAHSQERTDEAAAAIERQAVRIFNSVMSPFCPGVLIANCPSSAARDLEDEIREQLASGATVEAITEGLYQTYGDRIRAAPQARGFGLVAWVVPGAVFLVAGAALIFFIYRDAHRKAVPKQAMGSPLDAESAALLDEELSKID